MKNLRDSLLLYAVTDRRGLGEKTLVQAVEEALRGGATMIQLREKDVSPEQFIAEALALKPVCARYGAPLIINDNVEVALACDADGVHVGQDDTSLTEARAKLGQDKIIGVSAHNVEEALKAERDGADYLGSGSVFATGTKNNVTRLPLDELDRICSSVKIPVVAIGGIGTDNMPLLSGRGAAGAAVVSAIFSAEDIEAAAKRLRALAEKTFR